MSGLASWGVLARCTDQSEHPAGAGALSRPGLSELAEPLADNPAWGLVMVGTKGDDLRPFGLQDRVAIVTGRTAGIGFGISRGLAEAGAAVAMAGLDDPDAASRVAELLTLAAP
ncbi:MAG: hypothetical protein ACREFU_16990 [Acetobacteraceae bacterium]